MQLLYIYITTFLFNLPSLNAVICGKSTNENNDTSYYGTTPDNKNCVFAFTRSPYIQNIKSRFTYITKITTVLANIYLFAY